MRLDVTVEQLRFILPEVASLSGKSTVSVPGNEPQTSQFSAILVEDQGKWIIETLDETPVPVPASSYDALRQLGWLVGHWRDDSDEGRIDNIFRWSDAGSFLIRSFSGVFADGESVRGTQVIGWDPAEKVIRTWIFDSAGSFADGVWTRRDNVWIIKVRGVRHDGKKVAMVNVLKRIDDDTFTWGTISRELDGELLPNIDPITVVRQTSE